MEKDPVTATPAASGKDLRPRVRPYAIFTIVGVGLFWVLTMVLGFAQADYSHLERAVSELGMVGAPFGPVQRANFVLLGLAMMAFAVATHRAFAGRGLQHWLAPALLVGHGLGRMGEGIFAWNPGTPDLLVNRLHLVFGIPAVLSMIPSVFAVFWMTGPGAGRRGLRRYTLATGAVFLLLFLVLGPGGPGSAVPLGLGQRIGFLIWYLWVVAVAGRLVKDAGPTTREGPPVSMS